MLAGSVVRDDQFVGFSCHEIDVGIEKSVLSAEIAGRHGLESCGMFHIECSVRYGEVGQLRILCYVPI